MLPKQIAQPQCYEVEPFISQHFYRF